MRCWCQFSHGIFFSFFLCFLGYSKKLMKFARHFRSNLCPTVYFMAKKSAKNVSKYSFWLQIQTHLRLDCILWRVLLRLREITLWFVRIIMKTFVHGRVAKLIFDLWTSKKSHTPRVLDMSQQCQRCWEHFSPELPNFWDSVWWKNVLFLHRSPPDNMLQEGHNSVLYGLEYNELYMIWKSNGQIRIIYHVIM